MIAADALARRIEQWLDGRNATNLMLSDYCWQNIQIMQISHQQLFLCCRGVGSWNPIVTPVLSGYCNHTSLADRLTASQGPAPFNFIQISQRLMKQTKKVVAIGVYCKDQDGDQQHIQLWGCE